jgi:hypothetical protein
MSAANTKECVRELVGREIIGVLFDALPTSDRSLASGNKTLVFKDGSGFTFSNNGSFWKETADDIRRAVARKEAELVALERDIRDVLELAGVSDKEQQ